MTLRLWPRSRGAVRKEPAQARIAEARTARLVHGFAAFTSFDIPGYAKIAANLSLRQYGERRTLLSHEARTLPTDEASRRAFLRYWVVVSPGVGVVMRSLLAVIADEARSLG